MRILALETSGTAGSSAALDNQKLLGELLLPADRRSAQTLQPVVKQLLEQTGWRPADVEVVAVTVGPGSFTGLRIGVTAAKTFAYAVQAKVVAVGTLDVVAAQVDAHAGRVFAVLDAGRNQLYASGYAIEAGATPVPLGAPTIVDTDAWLAERRAGDIVCGPPLEKLSPRLPAGVIAASSDRWQPRAATVGQLAFARAAAGEFDDLWQLVPSYVRLSAAEERRL